MLRRPGICALLFVLLGATEARGPVPSAAASRGAAVAFVEGLDEKDRARAVFSFEGPELADWHYFPRERPGILLSDIGLAGRERVQDLLRAGLSESGLLTVNAIVALEGVLGELEGNVEFRDPERYALAIFGDPSSVGSIWGWRFEGHHLSVGIYFEGDRVRGVTPLFLGVNPAVIPTGPLAGQRLLASEEELALDLVRALDEEERSLAVVAEEAPADVLFGPGRSRPPAEGVPYATLDPAERALLWSLVRLFAHQLRGDVAADELARIESAGRDAIRFAWAGPTERLARRYYRITGPTFVIELDRTAADPGHVHALWRDPVRDLGESPLASHRLEPTEKLSGTGGGDR